MSEIESIDVVHVGSPRVICCHKVDGDLVDPGPTASVHTLLEALGDERPAARAADPHPPRPRGRRGALVRALAATSRSGSTSAARRTSSTRPSWSARRHADLRRRDGPPVGRDRARCREANVRRPGGRRAPSTAGASPTRRGTRSTTSPTCTRTSGWAFAGDVAGVRIGDGADHCRRRRRRTSTSRRGSASIDLVARVGAVRAGAHALRHVRRRRRAPRAPARGARPLGAPARDGTDAAGFERRASAPRLRPARPRSAAYRRRCRPSTLYGGPRLGTGRTSGDSRRAR